MKDSLEKTLYSIDLDKFASRARQTLAWIRLTLLDVEKWNGLPGNKERLIDLPEKADLLHKEITRFYWVVKAEQKQIASKLEGKGSE